MGSWSPCPFCEDLLRILKFDEPYQPYNSTSVDFFLGELDKEGKNRGLKEYPDTFWGTLEKDVFLFFLKLY